MLDADSDAFTPELSSQSAQQTAATGLDAAILMPLPASPQQSMIGIPETIFQDVSSVAPKQHTSQSCNEDQNYEASVTTQKSSDLDYHQAQRSGTPFSSDEGYEDVENGQKFTETFSNLWTEKEEHIITEPFDYIKALPGKNFRAQILAALNVWLQVDDESLNIIDKAVQMLHNASLLIDDIQDGSDLRRGCPAAHRIFGTAQSINSANYMYFLAQQELLKLKDSDVMQIFIEELLNLHRGQGIELFWRDTLTVPTEEEYLLMISNKTGGLFRLAARLMQAVSSTTFDILPIAELVGLLFQIRDDYQNLSSEQMASAKGFCEDLTEGKFSLPLIHSIRNSPTRNNEVLNILRLRTTDVGLKSHALRYMQSRTNSLTYTKDRLGDFHRIAQGLLARIDARNELLETLLRKLSLD